MAQIYKVIKPLELSGKAYRLGEEVALGARDAEELMNKGFLANTRNGFPNTASADAKNQEQSREPEAKDAELMADHEARKEAKHAELQTAEADREQAVNAREAEKDETRLAKVAEAKTLADKVGRDDHESLEAMSEDQLDKEIADMAGVATADTKEKELRKPVEPKPKTK